MGLVVSFSSSSILLIPWYHGFKNTSGPQSEKIKTTFQRMFKNKGLDIIINCNMKIVNYLDVTLNLNDESYRPYKKPNKETNYIHVNFDHPPSILK